MKKLLILVWCLPLLGSHYDLTPSVKLEFVQKRLDMMKSQLAYKLKQILSSSSDSNEALQLKQEIASLKRSIPVTQNSLNALKASS